MRWTLKNGRQIFFSDNKYRIDWEKKAPSKGSQEVKDYLQKNAAGYVWYEEYRIPGTRLKIDFLCSSKKLAIEFHGEQHVKFNSHFFKTRNAFGEQVKRDMKKIEFLKNNGYTVLEIFEEDLPLTREYLKKFGITF